MTTNINKKLIGDVEIKKQNKTRSHMSNFVETNCEKCAISGHFEMWEWLFAM